MKNKIRAILKLLIFALPVILMLSVGSEAQSVKRKNYGVSKRTRDQRAIVYAKNYLVSNIESNLPRQSFERWFRNFVSRKARITWKVVDCGDYSYYPGEGGTDFTMCVGAEAALGSDVTVGVFLQVGTFKNGISHKKVVVRSTYIGREDQPPARVAHLGDLGDAFDKMMAK